MDLSRRRLLGALATSAATTACHPPPPPAAQRFVGQLPERGHRLRDGGIPEARTTTSVRSSVVIVGGGAAGMAAAWRLARAGVTDVWMLELEPAVGYPMGAHDLPAPHAGLRGLRTLLGDLGVILGRTDGPDPQYDPRFVCRGPVERHRYQGRWERGLYPAQGQTPDEDAQWERWQAHLRELDGRRGRDGRRLFDLPIRQSSDDLRHLDGISMATYLDQLGLDSWRLRWTVEYACRDDYGGDLQQTSAFAGLHHYLCRGLEDETDRFILTWPQGNAWLVEQMAQRVALGDRLRSDTVAHFIDPDRGEVHAWDAGADEHLRIAADVVLWAAPRFVLPRVLPPGTDPMAPDTLTYSPWLVANVQVRRPPGGIGAPLSWDNVPVGSDNLGYVVATHTESLRDAITPGSVLTFYEPLSAEEPAAERARLLAGSLQTWSDHVVAGLEGMHPGITADIAQIDIARWGHAMVRPKVGHLFSGGLARPRAPTGRIVPCAADVGGLPLFEEAWSMAVAAAEDALSRLGRPEATVL